MIISPEKKTTLDGSHTLVHPTLGELYHSDKGAVGEAMHVYIKHGLQYSQKEEINILEMGFGSGLNAFLTLKNAPNTTINYYAIELYPINLDTARGLNYSHDSEFMALHHAPWGESCEINKNFTLTKWEQDLLEIEFFIKFDLVYFDAFAPDAQPKLWSCKVFKKIADAMNTGAILVTYSSKGIVKQALRDAGFKVQRLEGALGKHHMLRAIKL
ncbi:MAG: tRNA (5-methylaminomethyl-2-thiouridine)(34)-methyltransferase MnmD [Rikenellaceae bacterium]